MGQPKARSKDPEARRRAVVDRAIAQANAKIPDLEKLRVFLDTDEAKSREGREYAYKELVEVQHRIFAIKSDAGAALAAQKGRSDDRKAALADVNAEVDRRLQGRLDDCLGLMYGGSQYGV